MTKSDEVGLLLLIISTFLFGMFCGWSATSKSADIIYTDHTAKGFHKQIKKVFISTAQDGKDTYILYYMNGKILKDKPVEKDYREIKVKVH
jgi:hypothetical protein